jgi:hypothetical protein
VNPSRTIFGQNSTSASNRGRFPVKPEAGFQVMAISVLLDQRVPQQEMLRCRGERQKQQLS